jgi:prepilin-type N-terminal cleavage/methylation domain-containing protein
VLIFNIVGRDQMMKLRLAFSLVELMVVIAIVAILAAVAIPSYNNYIIGSRIASLVPVFNNLIDKSIEYASTHGRYGNPYDLGLATIYQQSGGGTDPNMISIVKQSVVASMSPYIKSTWNMDFGEFHYGYNPAPCGVEGALVAFLDPVALGFSSSVVDSPQNIRVACHYWFYNGVNYKQCFYGYGNASTSQTANIVPGWINFNTTSGWDANNLSTYYLNTNSYINRTCQ